MTKTTKGPAESIEYSLLDHVFQDFFLFICLVVSIVYIGGVFVLFNIVRPLADKAIRENWSFSKEDTLVKILIFMICIIGLCAGAWLLVLWKKLHKGKLLFVVILLGVLCSTYFLFPSPDTLWNEHLELGSAQYTFGPYPNAELLAQLKLRKFDTVISLLSPLVIPVEPRLIREERKLFKGSHITLIEAPLLPWIGARQNKRSLALIKKTLQKSKGRYYIHCYLGRDRIRMVMKLVEKYPSRIRVVTPGYAAGGLK